MTVEFSTKQRLASAALRRLTPHELRVLGGTQSMLMDLCAADGVNGNPPIDWEKLIEADDATFMHDIKGIYRHINRATGKLENFFVPRCTKIEGSAS